jgi:uncharacterized RDD family membrane protein YckC
MQNNTKLAVIKPIAVAVGVLYALTILIAIVSVVTTDNKLNATSLISGALFQVAMLVGVIVFFSTNFKRDEFLKFTLSIQILTIPIVLVSYTSIFKNHYITENFTWHNYLQLVIGFVEILIAPLLLTLLCKRRIAKTQTYTEGGQQYAEFTPTNVGLRVLHYFVDIILFTIFAMANLFAISNFFNTDIYNSVFRYGRFDGFDLYIALLSVTLIFYTFFELVFKATPAKMLTNTIVVNQSANRMGILQALGRSLTRFIPFEGFSFIADNGTKGWHDTLTSTYVIDAIFPEEAEQEPMFDFEKPEFNESGNTTSNTSTS